MTAAFDIVVPALALRHPNGDLDFAATRQCAPYASRMFAAPGKAPLETPNITHQPQSRARI